MDDPLYPDCVSEDILQHHPWRVAGDILDPDEYLVHGRLIHHVPLRSRGAVRVQRRGLRQSEHVGADRRRSAVYTGQEILAQRADHALPPEHALHALRPDILHHQFSRGPGSRDSEIAIRMS